MKKWIFNIKSIFKTTVVLAFIPTLINCSIVRDFDIKKKNDLLVNYLNDKNYEQALNLVVSSPKIKFKSKSQQYNDMFFFLGKYSLRKKNLPQQALVFFEKEIDEKKQDNIVDTFLYYSYLSVLEIKFDLEKDYDYSKNILLEALQYFPNDSTLAHYYISCALEQNDIDSIKDFVKKYKIDYDLFNSIINLYDGNKAPVLDYLIKKDNISKKELELLKAFYFTDSKHSDIEKAISSKYSKGSLEYLFLAKYYLSYKKPQSLTFFNKFIEQYDKNSDLDFLLGDYYMSVKLNNSEKNIKNMESIFLQRLSTNSQKARLYEYLARLYSSIKGNEFSLKILDKSLEFHKTDESIWLYMRYILFLDKSDIKYSMDNFLKYVKYIKDKEYFSDVFDRIATYFLENLEYEKFHEFYNSAKNHMSDEDKCKFNLVLFSLIKNNLIKVEKKEDTLKDILTFLEKQNASTYYNIISLYLQGKEININEISKTPQEPVEVNELEKIILGYIYFELEDIAYNLALPNRKEISTQTLIELSKALNKKQMWYQSLRIIGACRFRKDFVFSNENLKLIYPMAFDLEMKNASQEFNILPELFYGLVRAESFFDPNIGSRVGAKGLSQLMDGTAAGVAKGLGIENFNVYDPYSNLRVGNKYLRYLLDKFYQNISYSISGYNAGYGNLQKWLRRLNTSDFIIFSMSVPFWDTRHYIKDILEASMFYGALYYDKNPKETVDLFFANFSTEEEIGKYKVKS